MCESVYQKRGACWNQSSRWKSLHTDRRTRPLDQRRGGGVRCQDCNNQRKAKRARWVRATSSRRDSEIVIELLFALHRNNRVDPRCAPGWQKGGANRDQRQGRDCGQEAEEIQWTYLEQQARERTGEK